MLFMMVNFYQINFQSQISSCKDCRHLLGENVDQPANNRAMNNSGDPLTLRTQERIHELELELAQTKLARVEAECLNQVSNIGKF